MEFDHTVPVPPRPQEYRPVSDMLRAAASIGAGCGTGIQFIIRNGTGSKGYPISNGLEMHQARIVGMKQWVWVARIGPFCAWLSHRRLFAPIAKCPQGRIRIAPPANSLKRRAMSPAWVAENTKPARTLARLTNILVGQNNKGKIEWRKPIT